MPVKQVRQTAAGYKQIIRNQMKKYIHIIILTFASALFFAGCSKETAPEVDNGICGEWRLTSWNGAAPGEDFSVYMELLPDGSFNLYQKVYTSTFDRYSGTYTADGNIFSGSYSDGEPMALYSYEMGEDGNTLTLTATGTGESDVCIYTRTGIPDDVRSAENALTKSGAEKGRRFL